MRRTRHAVEVLRAGSFLVALLVSSGAYADEDACAAVECSGHGRCFEERGVAACLCDPGFTAVSLSCAPGADEGAILRARRDPRAGERVADLAMAEVGRRRHEVGADLAEHAHPLAHYLMPGEWWCSDFVAWIYEAAGVPLSGGAAGGWLVSNNVAIRMWFEARDQWIDHDSPSWSTFVPSPGDYIRFDTDRGGHAAIVHHVSGDTIYAVEGNVGAHVELERYYHFRANPLIDGFGVLALPNEPPTASAPEDARHAWRRSLRLRASVSDDGPPELLAITWAKLDGPGEVRFDDPSAPATSCSFTAPGQYVLRLEVSDGEHTVADEVAIDAFANQTPIVQVELGEVDGDGALLRAAIDDDGEPALRWMQISGPGRASFSDEERAETSVSFSEPGAYVLRLTADDGELSGSDDVWIDVPGSTLGCRASPGRSPEGGVLGICAALVMLLARRRT